MCHYFLFCIIDFSEEKIIEIFNSDLANNYGNLLQRVTTPNLRPPGMDTKICTDLFSLSKEGTEDNTELLRSLCYLPEVVRSYYEEYRFGQGIEAVLNCLQMVRHNVMLFYMDWLNFLTSVIIIIIIVFTQT